MARHGAFKNILEERRNFLGRIAFAGVLCLIMTLILVARLVNLQVLEYDYYSTRANDNRMRLTPVPPVRGLIYDRHGALLAQNKPAFVLEMIPEKIENLDATLAALAPLVSLTEKDIERFKDRVKKTPRYRGVPLRTNLSMEEVARYEINRHYFQGVDVTAGLTRNYPIGTSAAHVVGYVGGITGEELKAVNEKDYEGLTQIGKIGVEKSHEQDLRGTPGAKIIEANAYGRPLRELDYRRGAPGRNLILSLDTRVQLTAEKALGELTGAVVAIDPRNGEVIAMVSKPGFDPQLFVEGIDFKSYKALNEDKSRPLFNRALQGQYPPGSTIKPAMAIAGLEFGVVEPSHGEFCRGEYMLPNSSRKYRCWKRTGHGWMDMVRGVMHSCDVYFYELANKLGIDRIHESMNQFGLGKQTGIDLPLEKSGLMPSREWKRLRRKEAWYPGETLNTGIGQGYMLTTPLQLAQMTARIAMRGGGFEPHLVHAYEDVITRKRTPVAAQALPRIQLRNERNWDAVHDAMVQVAHTPGGTAYRIGRDAPYRLAAKTGTAQVAGMAQNEAVARDISTIAYELRDHALFIAFAPAEAPQIAVAVIAEHAGSGSSAAAPIARQVMDMALLGEVLYNPVSTAPVPAVTPAARNPAAPAAATAAPSTGEQEDRHIKTPEAEDGPVQPAP